MNHHETTGKRHHVLLQSAWGDAIQALLQDDAIIEIMLNPDGKLWAESLHDRKFDTGIMVSPKSAENIIKLVASHHHAIVNADHPEIACELPENNARFQGWIAPVVSAPCFTIRKHTVRILSLEDYVNNQQMTQETAQALREAILNKKNILIAGGTGSGKTTLANALLNELKTSNERIIVIEDLPELQIAASDCVKLRTTPTKTMRDLVKGVLRMRPDRIIIGEVRDGAALELLKAWNTGHPGGVCTLHANSAEAAVSRLEDLIQEVVQTVPKRLITDAIDLIVFMQRDKQGKHCVYLSNF